MQTNTNQLSFLYLGRVKKLSSQFFFLFILLISNGIALAQTEKSNGNIYVDSKGIMRWEQNKQEVYGFGVNYTVPFAHAYRSAIKMGIDPKKAIENDVYHFSRLGFNLYRVHVWDTEISDTLGNLIENEHLKTFDFLLKALQEQGIRSIITPIAFWGNGWPEPDENTTGFSHKYGKDGCLTDPEAIKAQQNYLSQFLNHINSYTGIAYKDDPNILAIEISNEPHHQGDAKEVKRFIKSMVKAIRKSGTKKPIFYNTSHAVHLADAYFESGIQGGTFQWYPAGLGYQRELSGNLLPNVNDYIIPFAETIKKHKAAKIVYEFDAADVGKSYIYPAMARSFREAGIQLATHFAYDPTYLAYANTEYNTHYMNLAYTPQKALSLMISAEVFHQVPMRKNFGIYPQNLIFADFKVNYEDDLAEYNSENKFIYTNSTKSKPKNENTLKQIAGFGNSNLIEYNGLGAYFLDKIEDGLWRLEVMPDAVWVDNPFGKNSLKKTIALINWTEHKMKIQVRNLGLEFSLEGINTGNTLSNSTTNGTFTIQPGTYILTRKGKIKNWLPNTQWKNNKLNAFYAPKTTVKKAWLKHKPITEQTEGSSIPVEIQYIAPKEPLSITLMAFSGSHRETIELKKTKAYTYEGSIPAELAKTGFVSYTIVIQQSKDQFLTYPKAKEGKPSDWDFYTENYYTVQIAPSSYPIHLFDAQRDSKLLVIQWRNTLRLKPTKNYGEAEYQINVEELFIPDKENLNAKPIYDYSFKHFVIEQIAGRKKDLHSKTKLIFKGRALNNKTCKLQIAFVMDDGSAFGSIIEIGTEATEYELSLNNLKPVRTVTLPRPYPTFLPYYLEHNLESKFDINRIESIQFSIGPEIPEKELKEKHGIAIISLRIE